VLPKTGVCFYGEINRDCINQWFLEIAHTGVPVLFFCKLLSVDIFLERRLMWCCMIAGSSTFLYLSGHTFHSRRCGLKRQSLVTCVVWLSSKWNVRKMTLVVRYSNSSLWKEIVESGEKSPDKHGPTNPLAIYSVITDLIFFSLSDLNLTNRLWLCDFRLSSGSKPIAVSGTCQYWPKAICVTSLTLAVWKVYFLPLEFPLVIISLTSPDEWRIPPTRYKRFCYTNKIIC